MNTTRLTETMLAVMLVCFSIGQGSVTITEPSDGNSVDYQPNVKGMSSAIEKSGINVYILVWPEENRNSCQVYKAETRDDGEWQIKITLGMDPSIYPVESGKRYRIMAIATKKIMSKINCASVPPEMDKSPEITLIVLG